MELAFFCSPFIKNHTAELDAFLTDTIMLASSLQLLCLVSNSSYTSKGRRGYLLIVHTSSYAHFKFKEWHLLRGEPFTLKNANALKSIKKS